MKRLFGTDGIRGVAGRHPLDPPTVRRFGAALAEVLCGASGGPDRFVLGRDTRESGPALRDAVAAGLASRGAGAVDAGVISTPGLARVVADHTFRAGVMISASHNPFDDNGLKVFAADGTKLDDALERRVEDRMLEPGFPDPGGDGSPVEQTSLVEDYVGWLERALGDDARLRGLRLVLDCANGSASTIGPAVFRHYGAEVQAIACAPDGRNINLGCGSLHVEGLAAAVRDGGYDLGIAFDGDADRALAVDRRGRTVDGDHILYLGARQRQREGRLQKQAVVATIMSNLWLEKRLADERIALHRAPVGDKYVLERMLAEGCVLGGEQSGHVIFLDHASTGDGILTGLLLLDALLDEEQTLETILDGIRPFPQVQLNIRVASKPDLREHPEIGPAVGAVERSLGGGGRVVLRYSGTEPVARVMVEGVDAEVVGQHARALARLIEERLGG